MHEKGSKAYFEEINHWNLKRSVNKTTKKNFFELFKLNKKEQKM